jgi:hypothetical protein
MSNLRRQELLNDLARVYARAAVDALLAEQATKAKSPDRATLKRTKRKRRRAA